MDVVFLVIERRLPIFITLVILHTGFDYQLLFVDILRLPHRHVFLTDDVHRWTHVLIDEFTRYWFCHWAFLIKRRRHQNLLVYGISFELILTMKPCGLPSGLGNILLLLVSGGWQLFNANHFHYSFIFFCFFNISICISAVNRDGNKGLIPVKSFVAADLNRCIFRRHIISIGLVFDSQDVPLGKGCFQVEVRAWGHVLERGLIAYPHFVCVIIVSLLLSPSVWVSFKMVLSLTISFNLVLLVFFMV